MSIIYVELKVDMCIIIYIYIFIYVYHLLQIVLISPWLHRWHQALLPYLFLASFGVRALDTHHRCAFGVENLSQFKYDKYCFLGWSLF